MEVILAKKCGFCPGVRSAISLAERVLAEEPEVYCLGPIIHNEDVVNRLAENGLKTVEKIDEIRGGTVLIRSHGASPSVIEKLKEKRLKIVDATCVLVKRLQDEARRLEDEGYKVIVVGDKDHPEVKSVVGCVKDVEVVAGVKDLDKIPAGCKLGLVCQTTKGPAFFGEVVGAVASKDFSELKVVNTLCKETVKRQEAAIEVCKQVDVMFVLGGKNSANTRRLVELCKKYNSSTFHLQNWKEFDKSTILDKSKAGVTAGASTPDWIIEEFVENLSKL